VTAATLQQRALAAGIEVSWTDAQGQRRTLSPDTIDALLQVLDPHPAPVHPTLRVVISGAPLEMAESPREAFSLDTHRHVALPHDAQGRMHAPDRPGHYLLDVGSGEEHLAVVPARCFGVGDLAPRDNARAWGVSAQVYGLRRSDDGGLGDNQAVAAVGRHVAAAGGDAVALSPLHASSPPDANFSPYSPSHRAWLDTLQLAPAQVAGTDALHDALEHSGQAQSWVHSERAPLIDWPAQDTMRHLAWTSLVDRWGQRPDIRPMFEDFMRRIGDGLYPHALFAAHQRLARTRGDSVDWRQWDAGWADSQGPLVRDFAQRHALAVEHECFMQWLAAQCWEQTQTQLLGSGQRIGLIWDLATGFDPGGSEAWQHRGLVVEGAHIGAPPDAFNPDGQDWGLAAYAPHSLQSSGYAPLRTLLDRLMSRGGGLRIDHILGWSRLWFVPAGMSPRDGGYVRYPLHDLLGLLALASWQHRCLVIGEDLGTVPADLRQTLASRGVYGMDVLQFTRDPRGSFIPPSRWRAQAVAMSSTHDLPPLAGWRAGTDLDALARAHAWNGREQTEALQRRHADMVELDHLLEQFPASTTGHAALRAVAESAAPLALFPLEDVLGEREQPNLPGTTASQHPNWRRRLNWRVPLLDATLGWIARHRRVRVHG
jgi:4-alpha-glucanotransferase